MARLTYDDPQAEDQFNENDVKQRFLAGVSPEASLGGRSQLEVNNPDVGGPSDAELARRNNDFAKQREKNRK